MKLEKLETIDDKSEKQALAEALHLNPDESDRELAEDLIGLIKSGEEMTPEMIKLLKHFDTKSDLKALGLPITSTIEEVRVRILNIKDKTERDKRPLSPSEEALFEAYEEGN